MTKGRSRRVKIVTLGASRALTGVLDQGRLTVRVGRGGQRAVSRRRRAARRRGRPERSKGLGGEGRRRAVKRRLTGVTAEGRAEQGKPGPGRLGSQAGGTTRLATGAVFRKVVARIGPT